MKFSTSSAALLLSAVSGYRLSDFKTKIPWNRPSEGFYELEVGLGSPD
jgi:hypothetical protein